MTPMDKAWMLLKSDYMVQNDIWEQAGGNPNWGDGQDSNFILPRFPPINQVAENLGRPLTWQDFTFQPPNFDLPPEHPNSKYFMGGKSLTREYLGDEEYAKLLEHYKDKNNQKINSMNASDYALRRNRKHFADALSHFENTRGDLTGTR